jgi:hypothetical protein
MPCRCTALRTDNHEHDARTVQCLVHRPTLIAEMAENKPNLLGFHREQRVHADVTTHRNPTMHSNTPIPAPRTEAWGFWGTMHEQAEAAWPLAIAAIAETTGESPEAARAFLDSRHGRHFADEVRNRLHADDTLDAAVRFATSRWMSWTIGRRMGREYDIPHDLPYLIGLTIHCALAEEASDA